MQLRDPLPIAIILLRLAILIRKVSLFTIIVALSLRFGGLSITLLLPRGSLQFIQFYGSWLIVVRSIARLPLVWLIEGFLRGLAFPLKMYLVDKVIFLDCHLDEIVEVGRLRFLP